MLEQTLSICIATMPKRNSLLKRLLDILNPQLTAECELLIDDSRAHTGIKRQAMLKQAQGQYVASIDDDDMIATDYIAKILEAANDTYHWPETSQATLAAMVNPPDCVGFRVERWNNGKIVGQAIHSLRYTRYADVRQPNGLIDFQRTPNHLCPIKRDIALQVGFRDISIEDIDYAKRIRPLLKTETFIDATLYQYLFTTRKG